jgi:hypothetical protein
MSIPPKTLREEAHGKLTFRLLAKDGGFVGLLLSSPGGRKAIIEGSDANDVWHRLNLATATVHPDYFGFDGARARFLHFYPGAFASEKYALDERDYKVRAKAKLDQTAPLDQAATETGFGEAVLSAFRATDLLHPTEKTRLQAVLRGPSADAFVRAAAHFTLGAGSSALKEMDHILRPFDNAKWTVVTYLPFLWRPDRHMYLKPEVTKDFAARVGQPLAYEPHLNIATYNSLLALVARTEAELADLQPRDRIDVQSLIWVVGQAEPTPPAA